jgi:hypothetical protein
MPAQPDQSPQQRQIRVLISSAFRDMYAEREELVTCSMLADHFVSTISTVMPFTNSEDPPTYPFGSS